MIAGSALFWWRWLVVVSAGVVVLGLVMVIAPGLTRQMFGLVVLSSAAAIDAYGAPAVAYISLAHAVVGAVMVGWGITLLFALFGAFRRGSRQAWLTVAVSMAVWFVTDTAFSLSTGFWRNAVLNLVLAVAFALPLAGTYRACHERGV